MEPPSKKPRKLLDDESSSDSGDESGGVPISNEPGEFKVNEDYARRFEHNKKREEVQQLEAKLGKTSSLGKRRNRDEDDNSGESDESSDDEDEDEAGELATEALDSEIMATLNAIRSKDPRVYDKNVSFYTAAEEGANEAGSEKKEKPMFLRDYHRENLLSGANLPEDDTAEAPKTYAQEQDELKNAVVKEMHGTADDKDDDDNEADEDGGFLIPKSAPVTAPAPKKETKLDLENADKDPEMFLSNFMSSRAWVPTDRAEMHPFESEDDEEDEKAEALEEAYNFRFEDPNKINEKLITHARDSTNKFSVRREEKSSRKKHREAERAAREDEKKQRETEKNRLRKLKVEELQGKVDQIKEVAGIRASKFTDEDWARFLDDAWDDKGWEKEMQKRFGDEYYEEEEGNGSEDDGEGKKKRPKKPTWDDDIDIKDIVPDFDDEEKPAVDQSDVDMEDEDAADNDTSAKGKKSKAEEKREQKRASRKERLRIEEAADRNLDLDTTLLPGATKKNASRFRYRETSPQSFGLTSRDILMADDSHLNQFAGLKKLASFRESEKKRRDQKKLGKKARLRQWRKDTFGNEEGPGFAFGGEKAAQDDATGEAKVDIREGEPRKKKRKRSKKH